MTEVFVEQPRLQVLTSPSVSKKETDMQKYLESLWHGCILRGPLQFVGRNFEQSPH